MRGLGLALLNDGFHWMRVSRSAQRVRQPRIENSAAALYGALVVASTRLAGRAVRARRTHLTVVRAATRTTAARTRPALSAARWPAFGSLALWSPQLAACARPGRRPNDHLPDFDHDQHSCAPPQPRRPTTTTIHTHHHARVRAPRPGPGVTLVGAGPVS